MVLEENNSGTWRDNSDTWKRIIENYEINLLGEIIILKLGEIIILKLEEIIILRLEESYFTNT